MPETNVRPTTPSLPAPQPRADALIARLQDVTERLAAARTQEDVFTVVLEPALAALQAIAGAVLLVNGPGDGLELSATCGYPEEAQTLWQDGPLDGALPAGDALQRRQALFFEHEGDLLRTYPDLETRGAIPLPVATAVLPMVLDEQPLGLLILDFPEPHMFLQDERRFLGTLASQCAIALGRARLLTRLHEQVQARTREADEARARAEVLAALGDALQRARNPEDIAARALPQLGPALRVQSMLVVRLDGEGIQLPTLWGNTPEPIMSWMTRPGLTLRETPVLQQVAETGRGVYLADYRAQSGAVPSFPSLASAVEPIRLPDGTLEGFLVAWRPPALGPWQDSERDLLRRAALTLGLALERAEGARQLQVALAEQARRAAELDAVIESMPDAVYIGNAQGIQRVNRRALEMLGFGSVEELHHHIPVLAELLQNRNPDTLERLRPEEEAFAIALGGRRHDYDVLARHLRTGEDRLIRTAAAPILLNGEVVGAVAVNVDITESRQVHELQALNATLEAQVQERTARLADVNAELRAYAASMSRDLAEPTRRITSFLDLIERRVDGALDEKSRHYVALLKDEAGRLEAAVRNLRHLALLERRELVIESVSLNRLIAQVRSDLEPPGRERRTEWVVGDLPRVRGDQLLLRQAFTEVLAFARAQVRTEDVPIIQVGCEELGPHVQVWVRDNGPGLAPGMAEALFEVNARAPGAAGMLERVGLPNVRRIVTRHGGRVWAASTPDAGSTLVLTLPLDR